LHANAHTTDEPFFFPISILIIYSGAHSSGAVTFYISGTQRPPLTPFAGRRFLLHYGMALFMNILKEYLFFLHARLALGFSVGVRDWAWHVFRALLSGVVLSSWVACGLPCPLLEMCKW
jgi:hypothetical protein